MKFETEAIHGVREKDEKGNRGNWENSINMASTFQVETFGVEQEFEYARVSQPTRKEFEKIVAKLEKGKYGFGFSSGMAAITSIFSKYKSGDHVILGMDIYGGTYRIITDIFSKYKLEYTFIDTTDLKEVEKSVRENTVAIFIETPSNPLLDVTDIRGIAKIAKKYDLTVIADNTFMTPYLQKPLELGADIVVHSATKFLSGHNDVVAGAVIVNCDKLAEEIWFAQKAIGAVVSPFDSWLLIRSLKTLKIRVEAAQENTLKLVKYFKGHPEVEKVYYPTEEENKGKEIHESQAEGGGAVFSFKLKNESKVKPFFERLNIALSAASLGGVETLVTHPHTVTHAEMPEAEKNSRGITNSLIRVAVGIENIDDLIEDFENALI